MMSNPLSTNVRNFRWFIFLVALLPIVSLLSGCSASSSTAGQDLNMAAMSDMPVDVQKGSSVCARGLSIRGCESGCIEECSLLLRLWRGWAYFELFLLCQGSEIFGRSRF